MITKLFIWILLTVFFSFAGIAVFKSFGVSYAYLFVLLTVPVFYLIRKYGRDFNRESGDT